MQQNHVPVKYVYSRLTIYHTNKIDLKWRRSIHHCLLCNLPPHFRSLGLKCGAIHHGFCRGMPAPIPVDSVVAVNCKEPVPVAVIIKPGNVITTPKTLINDSIHIQGIKDKEAPPVKDKEETTRRELLAQNDTEKESVQILPVIRETKPKRRDVPEQKQLVQNNNNINIPKFYFPMGKPIPVEETDSVLQRVAEEFTKHEGGRLHKHQMNDVTKACRLPVYWRMLLYKSAGGEKQGFLTVQMFTAMWRKLVLSCHDDASRFVRLLAKPGCQYLEHEDFLPLIQDVVDSHPGLGFLQEAPEFHSRYVNTVIARIFYSVNRSWSARITVPELRKSNFLQTLAMLEDEEDINQILDYFSYEHFYVIYCKFWELDKDHDLYIDRTDLARHNDHAISLKAIDRIFSGAVTRGKTLKEGKMSYPEFVWFLLSEEDKRHPRSIEYWFRVMDLDGDGVISMYEMEHFYTEQMQKMEALGIEKLPFQDALCQMLDLVKPKNEGQITLSDLKNCKLTNIFFDTFINLDKFLDHEQKDPFANVRDLELDGPEPNDWEKYAAEEYEALVAEEGALDQDDMHYEDDFETEDDDLIPDSMLHIQDQSQLKNRPRATTPEDDVYDFSPRDLGY